MDPTIELARNHVRAVRDFSYHLMTYVLINAFLVVIDRRGGSGDGVFGLDWAYWVIIFWGFGIAGHAISVFFGEYRVARAHARLRSSEPDAR